MTRRATSAATLALVLVAACGNDAAPPAGAGQIVTVTVTPTVTSTPSAAVTPAKTEAPVATSPSSSTPPAPTVTATPGADPSKTSAAPVAIKQWKPDHGVVATGWPDQKCELQTTRDNVIPHFDTPEKAMTFLTEAYNCSDIVALKRVTVAAARDALLGMTTEATNLKLDKCVHNAVRVDYDCMFTHDLPPSAKEHDANGDGIGTAWFVVGPADRSGWYMTVLADCGG